MRRAKNRFDKRLGLERNQIFRGFADTDADDRKFQLGSDSEYRASFGGAVQLGHHNPSQLESFLKNFGLLNRILACRPIDDQPGLVGASGITFLTTR